MPRLSSERESSPTGRRGGRATTQPSMLLALAPMLSRCQSHPHTHTPTQLHAHTRSHARMHIQPCVLVRCVAPHTLTHSHSSTLTHRTHATARIRFIVFEPRIKLPSIVQAHVVSLYYGGVSCATCSKFTFTMFTLLPIS
jgi:hypothetical protein